MIFTEISGHDLNKCLLNCFHGVRDIVIIRDIVTFRRRSLDNGKFYRSYIRSTQVRVTVRSFAFHYMFMYCINIMLPSFCLIKFMAAKSSGLKFEKLVVGVLQWSLPLGVITSFSKVMLISFFSSFKCHFEMIELCNSII